MKDEKVKLSEWLKTLPKKEKEDIMSWQEAIDEQWASRPGQHLAVYGRTGTGKTQALYWLVNMILIAMKEYIIWFDSGKSGEILTLLLFGPLKILYLGSKGLNINIDLKPNIRELLEKYEYDPDIVEKNLANSIVVPITDPLHKTWTSCDPNYINVISYRKFIIDPVMVSKLYSGLFLNLIDVAFDRKMAVPASIIIDELQAIAPSKKNALDAWHIKASSVLIANLQQCRSLGLRVVGASQGYEQVRPAARQAFDWMIAKRGCDFVPEQRKLFAFSKLWESCETECGYFIFPDRVFSAKLHLPYYIDGWRLGRVTYTGHIRGKPMIDPELQLIGEDGKVITYTTE
jgi:hypothetical protein